jgi:hypothetical protein
VQIAKEGDILVSRCGAEFSHELPKEQQEAIFIKH